MKKNIHPNYFLITAFCACGNKIHIHSTLSKDITLDICYMCHNFYTGKNKTIEKNGKLEKFKKRYCFLKDQIK